MGFNKITPEIFKKVQKMDRNQLEKFLESVYQEGFKDGSRDMSNVSVGFLLKSIAQIKGVGPSILKKITKIIGDIAKEEKIWESCLEKESEE